MSTRVVIADDHMVVRRGLRALLTPEEGFDVVAEAADLDATCRHVRDQRPDVLVLDLSLPEGLSLAAIPALRAECPETQIVVLTMQENPAYAREALSSGALGYVLKEAAESELIEAVRRATVGDSYLNPGLGARIAVEVPSGGVSERELEVLRMIALGYTNAEIAGSLSLSVRTVENHRAHVQKKLRIKSRAELVRYARQHGLMVSEDAHRDGERANPSPAVGANHSC